MNYPPLIMCEVFLCNRKPFTDIMCPDGSIATVCKRHKDIGVEI